jgi:hypothetical protein
VLVTETRTVSVLTTVDVDRLSEVVVDRFSFLLTIVVTDGTSTVLV